MAAPRSSLEEVAQLEAAIAASLGDLEGAQRFLNRGAIAGSVEQHVHVHVHVEAAGGGVAAVQAEPEPEEQVQVEPDAAAEVPAAAQEGPAPGVLGAAAPAAAPEGPAQPEEPAQEEPAAAAEPPAAAQEEPAPAAPEGPAQPVTLGAGEPWPAGPCRWYALWSVPGRAELFGVIHCSEPSAWAKLEAVLRGGQFLGSGARLRRYPSLAEALEGYRNDGPYNERARSALPAPRWTL